MTIPIAWPKTKPREKRSWKATEDDLQAAASNTLGTNHFLRKATEVEIPQTPWARKGGKGSSRTDPVLRMIIPKRKEAEKLEIGWEGDREDTNKKWSVTTTDWVCRKHWLDPVAKKTFEPNEAETQLQLFHTKEKMNKKPWVERHTTKELPSHGRDSHESQPEETTETELKSVKNANPQWRLSRWRSQMKEPEKKGGGNTTTPELVPQGDPVAKETLDPNESEDQQNPDSSQRATTLLRKVLRSERDRDWSKTLTCPRGRPCR